MGTRWENRKGNDETLWTKTTETSAHGCAPLSLHSLILTLLALPTCAPKETGETHQKTRSFVGDGKRERIPSRVKKREHKWFLGAWMRPPRGCSPGMQTLRNHIYNFQKKETVRDVWFFIWEWNETFFFFETPKQNRTWTKPWLLWKRNRLLRTISNRAKSNNLVLLHFLQPVWLSLSLERKRNAIDIPFSLFLWLSSLRLWQD